MEGYVETLLGRRRYFPILQTQTRDARTNIMQRTAEREAINHPIQGTAADIIKIAMINIHAELIKRQLKARLILQVHDELILEAPKKEADEVEALVCDSDGECVSARSAFEGGGWHGAKLGCREVESAACV